MTDRLFFLDARYQSITKFVVPRIMRWGHAKMVQGEIRNGQPSTTEVYDRKSQRKSSDKAVTAGHIHSQANSKDEREGRRQAMRPYLGKPAETEMV